MSLLEKLIVVGVLLLALAGAIWKGVGVIEQRGYDRRAAEDRTAMEDQAARNRDLQRASELRYTVVAAAQDRFIVQTITEIRHETDNLAACVLTPAASERLRNAAQCARGDSAAACGAGEPVRSAP